MAYDHATWKFYAAKINLSARINLSTRISLSARINLSPTIQYFCHSRLIKRTSLPMKHCIRPVTVVPAVIVRIIVIRYSTVLALILSSHRYTFFSLFTQTLSDLLSSLKLPNRTIMLLVLLIIDL